MNDFDLYIAYGIIGIVLIAFILSRMGVLPKKTLPFIIGALAAVFGLSLFQQRRLRSLRKDLEQREKVLKEKEEKLKELQNGYQASEQQLAQVKAELAILKAAYEKALLQIEFENNKEKERIDKLSGDELLAEVRSVLVRQVD